MARAWLLGLCLGTAEPGMLRTFQAAADRARESGTLPDPVHRRVIDLVLDEVDRREAERR